MLPPAFDYVAPETLDEALALLAERPDGRVLAGGQSLIPLLKLRLAAPDTLIDLRRLDELRYVRVTDGELEIGALTSYRDVATSPLLTGAGRALAEAAAAVGDPQVRNLGTLGGALAHADPAGDAGAAILALEATLVAHGPAGMREIPASDFFTGPWMTSLDPGEILTAVRIPARPNGGGAYVKLRQPASGFAIVGAAAVVEREGGEGARVRLAFTGVADGPIRAGGAESALRGAALDEATVAAACTDAAAALEPPPSDLGASSEYRRAMAEVCARRAILRAAR